MSNKENILKLIKNPNGAKYGLKFTDLSIYPFSGEHQGRILKKIPDSYWKQFLKEHENFSRPMTTLGRLLKYARERFKTKKPHSKHAKNLRWYNNGIENKYIHKDLPIPEGFTKGRIVKGYSHTEESKAKISAGLRKYANSEECMNLWIKLDKLKFMKKHTKLYMEYFGYDISDFIPCELTGCQAVDIHHIEARGMGGTKREEDIENLMAATRDIHLLYGDKKHYKDFLLLAHFSFMLNKIPYIKVDPFNEHFDILLQHPYYRNIVLKNRI